MDNGIDSQLTASPFLVLPRASEISGLAVTGPSIDLTFRSDVPGLHPIQEAVDRQTLCTLPFSVPAILQLHAQLTQVLEDLKKRGALK